MEFPIINLDDPDDISNACKKYGFFYVRINEDDIVVLNNLLNYTKEYFNKSEDIKMLNKMDRDGLGYAPIKKQDSDSIDIDSKESFSYRPSMVEYADQIGEYYDKMSFYANHIFYKIIHSLRLQCNDYNTVANPGFNTITLLHYSEVDHTDKNVFGIGPHTDWGLITLLYTTTPGLQIYIDSEWQDVDPINNHFIVNIGDMLERISDGQYRSTLHRVVIREEKYSIAFFFEPNIKSTIEPYNQSGKFEPIIYEDYIKAKLDHSYKATFS